MEKIGLKAVLDMSSFQQGMHEYVSGIDQMESETEGLAGSIDGLGLALGVGLAAATFAANAAIQEIRQELGEAVKDVYENTEEWQGLTKAYDNFWRSVVISAASRDELLGFFETLTGWMDQASEAALEYSASQEGYYVALNALIGAQEPGPLQDALVVLSQFGLGQVGQRAAGAIAIWAENQGWLNEEINLPGCLESVAWSDDIVVFDSFSFDRTVEIAKEYSDRICSYWRRRRWHRFLWQRRKGFQMGKARPRYQSQHHSLEANSIT